jgi:5-methylcytosine-specific restriction endonuclease McrA
MPVRIGQFVKQYLNPIFNYCDTVDHNEIDSLLNLDYSRSAFRISFPFCIEIGNITDENSMRFWTDIFLVRGKRVRVTSQWIDSMARRENFKSYLQSKGIPLLPELDDLQGTDLQPNINQSIQSTTRARANSRFKGNAIGNAQNLFIRNILSNLGSESFGEQDWVLTKEYFAFKCAYCGVETDLHMEHAIPINKENLGEHRLGNLIPSCNPCNSRKAGKDFKEFLADDAVAIRRIEEFMETRNYVPLEDSEQMKKILDLAHKEVAALASRYITIINELFPKSPNLE